MKSINEKTIINSIEQFTNIPHKYGHHRPEWYLSKYKFTECVLLDVFCTDYNHWCYEDYYYDNFSLWMVKKYQPEIDIVNFTIMWKQLNIILEAEFMSRLVIELCAENKPIDLISHYRYSMIGSYFTQIKKSCRANLFGQLNEDYVHILKTNKYIKKLNLGNLSSSTDIKTCEELVCVAQYVISTIPETYSLLLPIE